jgi:AcrR family transcriptional regulator
VNRSQPVDRSAAIKANIRAAASHLFAEQGYAATGIREIADEAGVDKSIVIRHFASKENLFIETISLPTEWTVMMEGSLAELSHRLILMITRGGGGTGSRVFTALLRASDSEEVRSQVRRGLAENIAAPLAARIEGDDAELRAHLFAAAVVGLLTTIWVVGDEVITRLTPEAIAASYAPALQALLDSPAAP